VLSVAESYERLMRRFCEWAKGREDVRAVFVIGSRARVDHPADEWADLDVVVVTTSPEFYVSRTDWLCNVGEFLLTFVEPTAAADEKERRVLFEGMLDVDFAIFPYEKAVMFLRGGGSQEGAVQLSNALGRGMRVLLDKDEVFTKVQGLLRSAERPAARKPSEQEFQDLVSDFLHHTVFSAKHLKRGELWWTMMSLDCRLQSLLRTMIEWHALAVSGWKLDVWFRGRFLEEWADPNVLKDLRKAFARYDEEDAKHALKASLALFSRIAKETGEKLGYSYPTEADEKIVEWVEKVLT